MKKLKLKELKIISFVTIEDSKMLKGGSGLNCSESPWECPIGNPPLPPWTMGPEWWCQTQ